MKNIQEITLNSQNHRAFYERFKRLREKAKAINELTIIHYLQTLEGQMTDYVAKINGENFWQMIPKILGIDSKLVLLEMFLLKDSQVTLSGAQILNLIENDYRTINQEFFGYHLNEEPNASLIFKVE